MLAYGNLLRLVENHTNAQIMELSNAGRPGQLVFKNRQALERRMEAAYKWAVEQVFELEGRSVDVKWVKVEVRRRRVENGVVGFEGA